jgi:hypothetical protein
MRFIIRILSSFAEVRMYARSAAKQPFISYGLVRVQVCARQFVELLRYLQVATAIIEHSSARSVRITRKGPAQPAH